MATDAIPGNVVAIKIGKLLHGVGMATVGARVVARAGGELVAKGDDLLGAANDVEKLLKKPNLWSATSRKTAIENALGHWEKHKGEFPELSDAKSYIEKVHLFVSNAPAGALVKKDVKGNTSMYHESSNPFVVISKDGSPRTMFRPID
ncbi:hypothetical protein [Desulfovibrio subterraneus]|uniref:hypothetical protein n=1 Tax=Desulfovibrio subterraneus TaxID=2718620 RepID=UPI00157B351A|nr:hypothetical protein [Desulfovibrio subterraneus]